jgi:hypothetical protein
VVKLECFVPGSECDLRVGRIRSQKGPASAINYGATDRQ